MNTTVAGIEYVLPKVYLLKESGIGVSEIASRTCYDSFAHSENQSVQEFEKDLDSIHPINLDDIIKEVNNIESSKLLNKLSWVNHHHSILEHTSLSFLIRGTSRGVLQEHARHRIHSLSVRSTRYTMTALINAFVATQLTSRTLEDFSELIKKLDMFVIKDEHYNFIEIYSIYRKLEHQFSMLGTEEFLKISLSQENRDLLKSLPYTVSSEDLFKKFQDGKAKRNVGDNFKHIVSDNWKVDLVSTFNLRSLKNYFDLRSSTAAYFQIKWLAQAMKDCTPVKYLSLIDKKFKP